MYDAAAPAAGVAVRVAADADDDDADEMPRRVLTDTATDRPLLS